MGSDSCVDIEATLSNFTNLVGDWGEKRLLLKSMLVEAIAVFGPPLHYLSKHVTDKHLSSNLYPLFMAEHHSKSGLEQTQVHAWPFYLSSSIVPKHVNCQKSQIIFLIRKTQADHLPSYTSLLISA